MLINSSLSKNISHPDSGDRVSIRRKRREFTKKRGNKISAMQPSFLPGGPQSLSPFPYHVSSDRHHLGAFRCPLGKKDPVCSHDSGRIKRGDDMAVALLNARAVESAEQTLCSVQNMKLLHF